MKCLRSVLHPPLVQLTAQDEVPAVPLQEAYLALQSIAVPERQRDCLHQLVTRLCTRGDVATLCSLPFADACVRREHGRSGCAAWLLASTLQARLPLSQACLQWHRSHAPGDGSVTACLVASCASPASLQSMTGQPGAAGRASGHPQRHDWYPLSQQKPVCPGCAGILRAQGRASCLHTGSQRMI